MTEPDAVRHAVRRAVPEPDTTAALRAVRSRHRQRRVVVTLAAVVVVVAGTLSAVALLQVDERHPAIDDLDAIEGWVVLADPPLPDAFNAVGAVWTGEEAIWWGGRGERSVPLGAAYDPATDQWRIIAEAPIRTRGEAVVVWSGAEMIVWGGYDRATGMPATGLRYDEAGAAYDPDTDSWRLIAPAPIASRDDVGGVWTGTEMIVAGGLRRDGPPECPDRETCLSQGQVGLPLPRALIDGAAYNPATDTWRRIADPPERLLALGFTTWTGQEALFFGDLIGWAYDPADDRWTELGFDRVEGGRDLRRTQVVAAGGAAMAFDQSYRLVGDADDPATVDAGELVPQTKPFSLYDRHADVWRRVDEQLPRPPHNRCLPAAATVGTRVAFLGCTQALLDPVTGQWEVIPPFGPEPDLDTDETLIGPELPVGTDDRLLFLDASSGPFGVRDMPRLIAYGPAPP